MTDKLEKDELRMVRTILKGISDLANIRSRKETVKEIVFLATLIDKNMAYSEMHQQVFNDLRIKEHNVENPGD